MGLTLAEFQQSQFVKKILELLEGPSYGFDPGIGPDLCPGPLIILLTLSLQLSLQMYAFGQQRYQAERRDV